MKSASDCRSRAFSAALLAMMAFASVNNANAQAPQQLGRFEQQAYNLPGHPDPNSQFVVLNSGIASIAAQRFQLPKDTFSYQLAGMTVFPYYQASPELKEFLNNATVAGMSLTAFPTQPNLPQFTLPQTDTIRFSVPFPKIREDRASAMKMAMKDKRMKDEIPWMVAHEGGQAFGLPGDSEALVIVKQGSMFGACASRTMVLRCGTMWVMTGSRPAAVITKYGAVGVRPNSIAAIEQTWFNRVTAADLYGQPLEIQLSSSNKPALRENAISKLLVERGKELILSDSAVASAGTSDFADANKGEAIPELKDVNKVLPDLKVLKANVDADASVFVSDLKTINPPFSNLKMSTDYTKMFEGFGITAKMRREEMKRQDLMKSNIASKNAVYKVSMDSKYYVPVFSKAQDKGPQIFPLVADDLSSVKLAKGNARVLGTCDLKSDANGKPAMSSGDAVVAAIEPILMDVSDCRVWINGGAVAQLIAKKDITIIRNLSEQRANSVKVKVKGRNIELPIGAEIVVARSAPEMFTELKNDGIERRNVHSIEISDGSAMINKSDIRLTSLMQYSPMLRKLYKSADLNDKKLVAQLMKTNVALNMVAPAQNYRRMAGLPESSN